MFVESKAVVYPNLRVGGLRKLALYLDFPWWKAESLEQLRWIENGYRIRVGYTDLETRGIDTPEDMEKALELF